MTLSIRSRSSLAAALLAVAGLILQASPAAAATSPVNSNPAYVHIFSANVENLASGCQTGGGQWWKQLVTYMDRRASTTPDIFVVEQINNAQLATLVSYMSAQLHGTYKGRMAKSHPGPIKHPDCAAKKHQGNAIIWRTTRFKVVHAKSWQGQHLKNGSCQNSKQDRTINQVIKFHDLRAGKYLSVSSIHWPTGGQHGPPCAVQNIKRANAELKSVGYGGGLRVAAGDTNVTDANSSDVSRPWYVAARGGKLNYKDAIYDMCRRTQPGAIRTCLNANSTFGARRIDYLFAKQGNGDKARTEQAHTISFAEAAASDGDPAGGDYSQHTALHSLVYYPTG